MKRRMLALFLSLILCISLLPSALAADEEPVYLISITTADGVVTSGCRDAWRWVALSRVDPGRPGILLRGSDPDVSGSLKRSDDLTVGDALDAWGRTQDGKPATLTLGKESWECTAKYADFSSHSVLYVEFPTEDMGTSRASPSRDTINLFRHDWAQQAAGTAYAQAVKEFQSGDMYQTEQSFNSRYGTVFISDSGPNPNGSHGYLTLICKDPCAKGGGIVVPLPSPRHSLMCNTKPPQTASLSADGETFTYSYHYDEPILSGWDKMLRPAGDFIYTVDLTTGEVTSQEPTIPEDYNTYAAALERTKNKKGWTTEQTLEAPACTVLLQYFQAQDGRRSYFLNCVYKLDAEPYFQGAVVSYNLTITKDDGTGEAGFPVYYTHRAPDSLSLNEDKALLTYTYSESLKGGPDTETLELATGYSDKTHTLPTAASTDPASQAEELAGKLKSLGLFLGDEKGNFNLDKTPTRVEALVMLIRALGEEPQAKAAGKTHPFTDVPDWADGYVSWGYAKGYTKGISATEFGSESAASCEMYLTFLLRALGYAEGAGADFTYDKPFLLAYDAGVFLPCVDFTDFRRSDVVEATAAALFAFEKGGFSILHERLTEAGAFTQAQFDAAFPIDPFSEARQVQAAVDQAMSEYWADVEAENSAAVRTHTTILLDYDYSAAAQAYTALVLSLMVGQELVDGQPQVTLAGAFNAYSVQLSSDLKLQHATSFSTLWGQDWKALIGRYNTLFSEDELLTHAREKADLSAFVPPAASRSYDQAVADLRSAPGHSNEQTFETDICTIFVFDRGGFMNAPHGAMVAIYKAGSPLGEGTAVPLPYARLSLLDPGTPADTMGLSEDKKTFTYTYHREADLVYEGQVLEKAGIITYTTDLATGETSMAHAPFSYDNQLELLTGERGYTVELKAEAPTATVLLRWKSISSKEEIRDYELWLIHKQEGADPVAQRLLLPSTTVWGGYWKPTDRAPDSLNLNVERTALTYVYSFDQVLKYGEDVLHEAGTYTYTVDLATGEFTATHAEN